VGPAQGVSTRVVFYRPAVIHDDTGSGLGRRVVAVGGRGAVRCLLAEAFWIVLRSDLVGLLMTPA